MFTELIEKPSMNYVIMESLIDDGFIDLINKEVDVLLSSKSKCSASGRLVGQIKNGEQLYLDRNIKIFDSIHKLGECMAEKYTSNYFKNLNIKNVLTSDLYNYMLNKNYSLVNWLHSDLVFIDNHFRD